MAKLNQKQTLLVIGGMTVLLCGAAGGGVYWAQGLIDAEKQEIDAKLRDIEKAQKKIKKIPRVEREVIVLRENVAHHVSILPQEADLSQFARTVHKFAIKSGIGIQRFTPVRGAARAGAFHRITYQLRFNATLWQFMRFMNFFETYERFVSINSFNLGGGTQEEVGADAEHQVQMTLETYVYNPKTSGKLTPIANYNNKKRDLAALIAAGGKALLEDPYAFSGREGRRDIFVDPRQKDTGDEIIPANIEQQRKIVEEFVSRLKNLKERWQRSTSPNITMFERIELRGAVSTGLDMMEEKIESVASQKLVKNPALNSRWYKEVQLPYKELVAKLKKQPSLPNKYLSEENFKDLITTLTEQLREGDLDQAVTRYNSLVSKLEVPKRDPRFPLRVKVESLVFKAKVALEFSQVPLAITGVLVFVGGKSGVILNGEVFQEGEYVTDTLFVKAVRQEEIEFVYKGFTLLKTF